MARNRYAPGIYSFNNTNSSQAVRVKIDDKDYQFAGGVIITSVVRNYLSVNASDTPMVIHKIGDIVNDQYNAPNILGNVADKA